LQVLVRNLGELTAVAADKGYNWEALRARLRAERITPLIPQRGPGFRGWAKNSLIHDRAYDRRSNAESVFLAYDSDTVRHCGRECGSVDSANL
jgi:IS5 family transposase